MKKVAYIFLFILLLMVGYYYISYHTYVDEINKRIESMEEKLNNKKIEKLSKNIIQEKKINIRISQSNSSVNHFLRIQAMMATYNDFFYESRIKKYRRSWKFDRLFWAYMSYFHFDNNEIMKVYLFYNYSLPRCETPVSQHPLE